jgi:citrate lyase beta subunit
MPGSKERALEKARSLPADGLILDMEDAVGLAEKEIARELVTGAVRQRPFGKREVIIRINGLDTQWGDADLEMAASAGPDAILVPKVENAAMVQAVAARLAALGAPEHTSIWAMMETPLAMLNAPEIAGSSARLSCLVMGTNDLVKELHAERWGCACWRRGPASCRSSTGSTTPSRTRTACGQVASRAARWDSTARP